MDINSFFHTCAHGTPQTWIRCLGMVACQVLTKPMVWWAGMKNSSDRERERERLQACGYRAWPACTPPKKHGTGSPGVALTVWVESWSPVDKMCEAMLWNIVEQQLLHKEGELWSASAGGIPVQIRYRRKFGWRTLPNPALYATVREVPWLRICDWNLTPQQTPHWLRWSLCSSWPWIWVDSQLLGIRSLHYAKQSQVSNLTDLTGLQAWACSDHKIIHLGGLLNVSTEVEGCWSPRMIVLNHRTCPKVIGEKLWKKNGPMWAHQQLCGRMRNGGASTWPPWDPRPSSNNHRPVVAVADPKARCRRFWRLDLKSSSNKAKAHSGKGL